MSIKLLTEHHLEFLSLKEGCTGSSESTLVKMPHCWKSHVAAQLWISGVMEVIFHGLNREFKVTMVKQDIGFQAIEVLLSMYFHSLC